jgi:hypothetical protein
MLKILFLLFAVSYAQYVSVNESYGYYCGYGNSDSIFQKNPINPIDYRCAQHDFCVRVYSMNHMPCHLEFYKNLVLTKATDDYQVRLKRTVNRIFVCYLEDYTLTFIGRFFKKIGSIYRSADTRCKQDAQTILGPLFQQP